MLEIVEIIFFSETCLKSHFMLDSGTIKFYIKV
jgi:hypothetical protein